MSGILTWLSGKKTYIGLGLGVLTVVLNKFGYSIPGTQLDPNNWLSDLWALGTAAAVRAGIGQPTK